MIGKRGATALGLVFGIVVAACGGSDPSDTADVESAVADPALTPGSVAVGSVDIAGTEIEYVTSVPSAFELRSIAPVLLALPPGGQDIGLARRLVDNTYAAEAQRLGWVVVSPAAPDGQLFFDGGEQHLTGFLDWVETWVDPEGGAPHVAGVSNGGISAFRYAADNPQRARSIVTFPGFARSDDDRAALSELTDVPIRMFVGENDTSWVEAGERTADEVLSAGGDVELTVFPDEGHIMASTADGVLVFEQLESFR